MEQRLYHYLRQEPKLLEFIREHPLWYRYLARDGIKRMNELEMEAKKFYGETFTGRLNRMNDRIQMASMLINVANILKD